MAWNKLATKTLVSASDTITTDTITTPKTFNLFLSHMLQSGIIRNQVRMGKTTIDTGSNYTNRISYNGSESTNINQSRAYVEDTGGTFDHFIVGFFININSNEKLCMCWTVNQSTSGAATAPTRSEAVFKWINTSDQADILEMIQDQAGDLVTDSNLTVLGTD